MRAQPPPGEAWMPSQDISYATSVSSSIHSRRRLCYTAAGRHSRERRADGDTGRVASAHNLTGASKFTLFTRNFFLFAFANLKRTWQKDLMGAHTLGYVMVPHGCLITNELFR